MSEQTEIDVGKTKDGEFYLDMHGERVLKSDKLSEIVDRIERELKKAYNIEEKKENPIKRFFHNLP
jgi:hypothetical protein